MRCSRLNIAHEEESDELRLFPMMMELLSERAPSCGITRGDARWGCERVIDRRAALPSGMGQRISREHHQPLLLCRLPTLSTSVAACSFQI
jgi:hypothetical protein